MIPVVPQSLGTMYSSFGSNGIVRNRGFTLARLGSRDLSIFCEEAALGQGLRVLGGGDGDVVLSAAARLELGQHLLVRRVEVLDEVLDPELGRERLLVVRVEVVRPVVQVQLGLEGVDSGPPSRRRRGGGGGGRRNGHASGRCWVPSWPCCWSRRRGRPPPRRRPSPQEPTSADILARQMSFWYSRSASST